MFEFSNFFSAKITPKETPSSPEDVPDENSKAQKVRDTPTTFTSLEDRKKMFEGSKEEKSEKEDQETFGDSSVKNLKSMWETKNVIIRGDKTPENTPVKKPDAVPNLLKTPASGQRRRSISDDISHMTKDSPEADSPGTFFCIFVKKSHIFEHFIFYFSIS